MIRRAFTILLANLRLSQRAVCEASEGRGLFDDFHDYPDAEDGHPRHFEVMTCKHCGKAFRI